MNQAESEIISRLKIESRAS